MRLKLCISFGAIAFSDSTNLKKGRELIHHPPFTVQQVSWSKPLSVPCSIFTSIHFWSWHSSMIVFQVRGLWLTMRSVYKCIQSKEWVETNCRKLSRKFTGKDGPIAQWVFSNCNSLFLYDYYVHFLFMTTISEHKMRRQLTVSRLRVRIWYFKWSDVQRRGN